MKYPMRKIAVACLFSLLGSYAWSVPAKPGLIVYRQPDGTELSVRLVGDEFSHYYMSEDGLLLLPDNTQRLCYAYVTPDGLVQASALQAREVLQRTDRELGFIETQDQSDVMQRFLSQSNKQANMRRSVVQKQRSSTTPYPTIGKQKVLVILAEYTDVKFSVDNPNDAFNRMLNEKGYSENGATGSARDYYMASSGGLYEPQIDVYGPVQLPNDMSYYGGNVFDRDIAPYKMIADACKILDEEVDFSEYDLDNDGFVDNVYLFYAGFGEADGGPAESVWPHQFHVLLGGRIEVNLDGVYIDRYACSNELSFSSKEMTGIGTFCHEFGHVLGLSDHYSTSYNTNAHPADWDIMASGSYLNSGKTPPLMNAFERLSLNWLEPIEVNQTDTTFVLPPILQNKAYRISTGNSDEYFLLENRQQTGWDTYLPGHGMLVWHVDYKPYIWNNNIVNDDPNHQYFDIEEADGAQGQYRSGNTFPGTSNVTSITSITRPSLKSWNGDDCKVGLYNIQETADSLILFDAIDPNGNLATVTATNATDITPVSFQANWDAVENATSYIIDVYEQSWAGSAKKKTYANGYLACHVGNKLSCTVTGLKPETKYFYQVRARGSKYIGNYSQPVEVVTGEKDYRFFAPEVAQATQVSNTSFVANWNELADSEKYNVSVFTIGKGELSVEVADFSKGSVVPSGWKTNVYSSVSTEGFYGKAPNAIFINRDKGYVSSPVKEETVELVSFWYRATDENTAENKLNIYGLNAAKEWVLLETISELSTEKGGETYSLSFDKFNEMFYAARIEFVRPSDGKVAIDDIEISYRKSTLIPLPQYTLVEVKNALSLTVEDLQPETLYAYYVRGNNGVLDSEFSSLSYVRTLAEATTLEAGTDCTNVYAYVSGDVLNVCGTTAGTPVCVFDVSGRRVVYTIAQGTEVQLPLPTDGIYLVRVGGQTLKAVR